MTKGRARTQSSRAAAAEIAREPNELKKKLLLVGSLSGRISKAGGSVFLVGGQAVETYTGGQFTTGDVDITTTMKDKTEAVLSRMGFVPEGMVWYSRRLGTAVHIVADHPSSTVRSRRILVGEYGVDVIGVEDLMVDRLAASKSWKSTRDLEQAAALCAVFADSLDMGYLRSQAVRRKVEDALRSVAPPE